MSVRAHTYLPLCPMTRNYTGWVCLSVHRGSYVGCGMLPGRVGNLRPRHSMTVTRAGGGRWLKRGQVGRLRFPGLWFPVAAHPGASSSSRGWGGRGLSTGQRDARAGGRSRRTLHSVLHVRSFLSHDPPTLNGLSWSRRARRLAAASPLGL